MESLGKFSDDSKLFFFCAFSSLVMKKTYQLFTELVLFLEISSVNSVYMH